MVFEEALLNALSQFQYTPIIFFLFGYFILQFYKSKLKLSEKILLSILISVGVSGIVIFFIYLFGNLFSCGLEFNCYRIIDSLYLSSIFEWIIIAIGSVYLLFFKWKRE